MSAVSGLAASIRSAVESETFDLGGSNAGTIATTIENAFSEPFPSLPSMIRLTFVTGAGKLGRARYDEGAAKAVTSTLRDLGYEEDRGASAVMECAGSFKLQHDTGKNLKTVVVFPKMLDGSLESGMGKMGLNGTSYQPLLGENSIEHKLAMASKPIFIKMLETTCPTWTQKKGCAKVLADLKSMADSIDQKLVSGKPLDDAEQEYYDSISVSTLEEKIIATREAMQAMVDSGNINTYDYKSLIDQIAERIQTLEKDIAEAQGKPKRIQNLQAAKVKAETRKSKIQSIAPTELPPLRNESEISKLRKELGPILAMEAASKGRLLTLKESQALTRKEELLEMILEVQHSSRGWFEPDDLFEARLKASNASWESTRKKAAGAKKKPAATSKPAASGPTKWVTPGSQKGAWSKPAKKTAKAKPGGLFAAMMEDSDSD